MKLFRRKRVNVQPTTEPQTTAPKKGVRGAIIRGFRAIVHRIRPRHHHQSKEADAGRQNVDLPPGIKKPNTLSSSISESKEAPQQTTNKEDIPSTSRHIPVSPSTKDSDYPGRPSMSDSSNPYISTPEDTEKSISPCTSERDIPFKSRTAMDGEKPTTPSIEYKDPSIRCSKVMDGITPPNPSTKDTPLTKDTNSAVSQCISKDEIPDKYSSVHKYSKNIKTSSTPSISESKIPADCNSSSSASLCSLSGSTAMMDQQSILSMESLTFHQLLGKGNFGKVYLASHPAIDKMLAVKVLMKRQLLTDRRTTRVFTERDVLKAGRESPYLIHLYGSFQTRTHLFYAMEFMGGGELYHLIKTAPLPPRIVRCLTSEILCGMQFLHSRMIVHRDLKPENILLNEAGHPKIADFGLSAMGVSGTNRIVGAVGTLDYMAPEVIERRPYYTMVDYFALGIIMFELAVGKHPFCIGNEGSMETARLILTAEAKYPFIMCIKFTDLKDLIERLLHKDQDERSRLVCNIRELPFFSEVNWADIEEGNPPPPFDVPPTPKSRVYKTIECAEFLSREEEKTQITPENQERFRGFSYTSESLKQKPLDLSPPPSSETQEHPIIAQEEIQVALMANESKKASSIKNEELHSKERSAHATNNATPAPVPSSSAMKNQPCALSMEIFTLHGILQQGGFGKVLFACPSTIGQKVAVNTKKKLLENYPGISLRDCDVLKACTIHLNDSFKSKNHLCYVEEFKSRGTLRSLIATLAPLDMKTFRHLVAELLCGMQFLHAKHIVHRDLRPENVFLDRTGHPKIGNFSCSVMGVSVNNMITGRAGTLPYMAPEVYLLDPYFTTADYFSLGVIAFELAFGKHPFNTGQKTEEELVKAMYTTRASYPEDIKYPLHDLLDKLLWPGQQMRTRHIKNLRKHRLLRKINWAKIEEGTSPSPLE